MLQAFGFYKKSDLRRRDREEPIKNVKGLSTKNAEAMSIGILGYDEREWQRTCCI
jgi:hypothetical protein